MARRITPVPLTVQLSTDLVTATEVNAAAARASARLSALIVTIVRNSMDPRPLELTLAGSLGLPAPTCEQR